MKINYRLSYGVSEIIGTMILLTMAVSVVTAIYVTVLNNLESEPDIFVDISGKIEQNDVIFEHKRGERLGLGTEITLTIAGREVDFLASDYLDENAKSDGYWNIGEQVIYPASQFGDIESLMIDITGIVDVETNSLVMLGSLQNGITIPYNGKGAIWLFDDGSGDTANDSSGHENHGDLIDGKWNDTISILNTSIYFDEVDDYVNVENTFSLTMTDEITIEAWINPLGNTASIDDYNFDSAFAYNPDAIHINEDIFAIAYIDSASDVILKTLIIESDGNIEGGYIDELDVSTLDANSCNEPNLVHITNDVYGICYAGDNHGTGWLKTFRINDTGYIFTDIIDDTLNFETVNCFYPNITHISGDIYAIAYEGKSEGMLITVEILSDGNISGSIIDNYEFESDTIHKQKILRIDSDLFAIAYISKNNDLIVNTIEISVTGDITDLNSFTLDTNQCNDPDIVHVSDDVYAVAYASENQGQGNVISFNISNTGVISGPIDSLIFDNDRCEDPDIIQVVGEAYTNYYAIAYASSSPHVGQVITIEIQEDGQIDDTVSYEFEYDGHHGYEPKILPVFGDLGVYLVIYRGYSPHVGYISTTLTVTDPTLPKDRGLFKDGVFAIYANATHLFGTINEYTISTKISLGWMHVALTYDSQEINLYVDGSLVSSQAYTESLNQISSDIRIGYLFHGYIDEIYVYENVLSSVDILNHYNDQKP